MASVQFRSSAEALAAFENSNCPAWSMWDGRQLLFKKAESSNADALLALEKIFEMIGEHTNAIYTLKVYESPNIKINDKTPADGSFNFRMSDAGLELQQGYRGSRVQEEKIAILEAKLAAMEAEEDEEEDETEEALGKIGSLLNNPVVMQLTSMLFGNRGGTNLLPAGSPGLASSLGNVPPAADQEQQIKAALIILRAKDARIGEHLSKLAAIAEKQPGSFEYLLNMLDSMNV